MLYGVIVLIGGVGIAAGGGGGGIGGGQPGGNDGYIFVVDSKEIKLELVNRKKKKRERCVLWRTSIYENQQQQQ